MSNEYVRRLQGGFHDNTLRKWQGRGQNITPDCMMYPVFVSTEADLLEEITTLPGQYKVGKNKLLAYLKPMVENGLKSIILFPTDVEKRNDTDVFYHLHYTDENPAVDAIMLIKKHFRHVTVACDVCLCGFVESGLCFTLTDEPVRRPNYDKKDESLSKTEKMSLYVNSQAVDSKSTLQFISNLALVYAKHGADIVAPSDMNDGRVGAIDKVLEDKCLRGKCAIMSYSAKFSSCMYGPFRGACDSTPITGNRDGCQLPPASSGLANRAVDRDIVENADIVMVKPSMMYLDIVRDIKQKHPHHPIAAYQVSGEYAMMHAAVEKGIFQMKKLVYENFTCMQRAGVDIIISYFTPMVLKWLIEDRQEEQEQLNTIMKKLETKGVFDGN
eukprot:TCONS_00006036-protein